jgi:hypothetical protein
MGDDSEDTGNGSLSLAPSSAEEYDEYEEREEKMEENRQIRNEILIEDKNLNLTNMTLGKQS